MEGRRREPLKQTVCFLGLRAPARACAAEIGRRGEKKRAGDRIRRDVFIYGGDSSSANRKRGERRPNRKGAGQPDSKVAA